MPISKTPSTAIASINARQGDRVSDDSHGLATMLRSLRQMAEAGDRVAGLIGRIDHTTLLPNREQFVADMAAGPGQHPTEPIEAASLAAGVPPVARTLVMVTLAEARHFNEILRAMGHAYAEDFVRTGAERLRTVVGAERDIYHVSVLSFAFCLDGPADHEAEELARSIAAAFAEPLACRGIPVDARVGVGLARQKFATIDPAEWLRASLAAAQDSRSATHGWAWYNEKSDQQHVRAFRLLSDLKAAVQCDDQLALHFQPRIDLSSGRCSGVEALLRWNNPWMGAIPPAEFVPLAEATALITPLTRWVIDRTLARHAAWRNRGIDLEISMNISPKNVLEPDFVAFVLDRCAAHGADPTRVELEFTEGTLALQTGQTAGRLAELRAAGIKVAIDDFGSGYSNMSYLMSLPAETLKIDQAFVRPLDDRPRNGILIQSIIGLGHQLGYRVVAEGIETKASFDKLASWGCDEGQGFFMSRPLAETDFLAWLHTRSA